MNLPPPVAKDAYNKNLIQIEKAAKVNAEDIMKDAAKRLRERLLVYQLLLTDSESKEYKDWKDAHELKCEINHKGSSEEMKAVAAVVIFSRSINTYTRQLKYSTFVGDGDSSSFGWVKEALER
ncbi:Hypothetical predicted protein [Paramuricea clavata]|uniref:Mutator-like transposase domain-containing protein n=1 Tax=Paramuricea clavata TaxID=317549 RepID=A0A6S7H1N1_PARCT|nr:Hypothetical predicted protein [Paramuricea clavata]